MAGDMNTVNLTGRVGGDPEIRNFPNSSDMVANFSLATTERWKDKNGEAQERTQWHRITVRNQALINSVITNYIKKGSYIGIEAGTLEYRDFTDKDNNKRTSTEIVISPFKGNIILINTGARDEARTNVQAAPARNNSNGNGARQPAPARATNEFEGTSADFDPPF